MTRYRVGVIASIITVLALAFAYANVGYPTIRPGLSGNMEMVGNHMQMLTATTADSFTPQADPLPESRWTATASDQSASHPASDAIDGNGDTFWSSNRRRHLPALASPSICTRWKMSLA